MKMKAILHKSDTRGFQDHGWLKARHTFSFANYYDKERLHFGVLRVLNDDIIEGGQGFSTHPHDNMEIITIPLKGALAHKDSMGNGSVIKSGEIQIMSAGTGIFHSEFNPNENEETNLLQIWIFPDKRDVKPRYQQLKIDDNKRENEFCQIISPDHKEEGGWIYQHAWLSVGEFTEDKTITYRLKSEHNGLYVFIIEGEACAGDIRLSRRDGLAVSETDTVSFSETKGSKILLLDVPLQNGR